MEQKKEEFHLQKYIEEFNSYIHKYISNNISKIHRNTKIHLEDECYNLVRNLYYGMATKGNIRSKYLVDMAVTVGLIDYLLGQLQEEKNIESKKIEKAIGKLAIIKTSINGWRNTNEALLKKV